MFCQKLFTLSCTSICPWQPRYAFPSAHSVTVSYHYHSGSLLYVLFYVVSMQLKSTHNSSNSSRCNLPERVQWTLSMSLNILVNVKALNFNLRYDLNERLWILRNSKYPTLRATSEATMDSLLIGQHLWTIENDTTR